MQPKGTEKVMKGLTKNKNSEIVRRNGIESVLKPEGSLLCERFVKEQEKARQ